MITANELRPGNLLYRTDGTPMTVRSLIYNDLDILVNEHSGLFTFGYTALPIPLTEEILLKCNLKFNKKYPHNNKQFEVYEFTENSRFNYYWDGGNLTFLGREIKYLHQLQNLYFALQGKELEINL